MILNPGILVSMTFQTIHSRRYFVDTIILWEYPPMDVFTHEEVLKLMENFPEVEILLMFLAGIIALSVFERI